MREGLIPVWFNRGRRVIEDFSELYGQVSEPATEETADENAG